MRFIAEVWCLHNESTASNDLFFLFPLLFYLIGKRDTERGRGERKEEERETPATLPSWLMKLPTHMGNRSLNLGPGAYMFLYFQAFFWRNLGFSYHLLSFKCFTSLYLSRDWPKFGKEQKSFLARKEGNLIIIWKNDGNTLRNVPTNLGWVISDGTLLQRHLPDKL